MRFDVLTQILVLKMVTYKVSKFANSKWQAAAILKIVYSYINDLLCVGVRLKVGDKY